MLLSKLQWDKLIRNYSVRVSKTQSSLAISGSRNGDRHLPCLPKAPWAPHSSQLGWVLAESISHGAMVWAPGGDVLHLSSNRQGGGQ